jgi:cytoskeletal protein RodZ
MDKELIGKTIEDTIDVESLMDDSSIGEDTTTPESSNGSSTGRPQLAQKEHTFVKYSKVLVILVLLMAGAVIGYFAFRLVSQEEEDAFETQVCSNIISSAVKAVQNGYSPVLNFKSTMSSVSSKATAKKSSRTHSFLLGTFLQRLRV